MFLLYLKLTLSSLLIYTLLLYYYTLLNYIYVMCEMRMKNGICEWIDSFLGVAHLNRETSLDSLLNTRCIFISLPFTLILLVSISMQRENKNTFQNILRRWYLVRFGPWVIRVWVASAFSWNCFTSRSQSCSCNFRIDAGALMQQTCIQTM